MKVVAVIPARYGSSRLPGKPLADICGKPMIRWVYDNLKKSKKIDEIYAAIDDYRVEDCCKTFSIPYIMTSSNHCTAANRLYEVSQNVDADFYIQVNGDEPLIDYEIVEKAIPNSMVCDVEFGTNLITEVKNAASLMDPSNIKVVFDDNKNMVYMSRTPIPYPYKSTDFKYFKHLGIIGYNKKMLSFYDESRPGPLEMIEGIDTLRFIDYKKQLKAIEVESYSSLSVDTENDLREVRRIMEGIITNG